MYSKIRLEKFVSESFICGSVFGELMQISLNFKTCWNLKIRGHFNFESNCDVLKSNCLCFLVNRNINFYKYESALVQESQIKSETVTSWSWSLVKEKKDHFLYDLFCLKEIFLTLVFYFNV